VVEAEDALNSETTGKAVVDEAKANAARKELDDAKDRLRIPRELREALGLKPGDPVAYALVDGEIRIRRVEDPFAGYGPVARQVLRGYEAPADSVPSEHVPTRREHARRQFAELLDTITAND